MKLLCLALLAYLITWALLSALHGFVQENWQALEPTTRWLLKEAAPGIASLIAIAVMVLSFMVTMGDS